MRYALLASILLLASSAAAQPSQQTVRSMLMGYETVPTLEQWRALGPDTLGVLISLYDDAQQPPFVRLRAVSAVAAFPTPAARTFLLAVARAEGQGDLLIREAVLALGRAFGTSARTEIRTFLTHREPLVREAAQTALARSEASGVNRREAVRGDAQRPLRVGGTRRGSAAMGGRRVPPPR